MNKWEEYICNKIGFCFLLLSSQALRKTKYDRNVRLGRPNALYRRLKEEPNKVNRTSSSPSLRELLALKQRQIQIGNFMLSSS